MAFDVEGARKAGYSEREIADFLGRDRDFDTGAALRAGYSPADIIQHLGSTPSTKRTYGEALGDIGAGVVGGIGSLVQLPGQLYGLTTGDFSKTGLLGLGERISQAAEQMKSEGLKAREARRQAKIEEAEKTGQLAAFKTAFGETASDPGLLLNFLAEQAPQLLVPFGAAKVAKGAMAARGLEEAATRAAATRAALGAGAVQQGADVGADAYENIYNELRSKGASETDAARGAINLARAAGASGAVISLLAQRLPGARTIEESFAGIPGKAGRVVGAGKGALGEGLSEIAEETGGKAAANLAMQQVKPEQELTAGLGATAGMAALGGAGLGSVTGALRTPAAIQPPPAPPAPPQPPAPPAPPQVDLTRPAAELILQREALRAQEKTPEVVDAIKQLDEQIKTLNVADVEAARAQIAQRKADEEKAAQSAFAAAQPQQMEMREFLAPGVGAAPVAEAETEPTLREQREEYRQGRRELREQGQRNLPFRYTAEGEPTSITPPPPPRIYMSDIQAIGVPFKTARDWFDRNVVNRTKEEVAALVQQDPSLVKGQGSRAKILRTLLGPEVPAFKEPARGKPTTGGEPTEPGADQRGVGVPSAPPVAGPAEAAPAAAPEATVPAGLARPEPTAPTGVAGEGQRPAALAPTEAPSETVPPTAAPGAPAAAAPAPRPTGAPVETAAPAAAPVAQEPAVAAPAAPVTDTRTASAVQDEIDSLRNKQQMLLTPSGRIPAPKSKARAAYDALEAQVKELLPVYDQKAEAERQGVAADMQRRMEEQQKKTAAGAAERAPDGERYRNRAAAEPVTSAIEHKALERIVDNVLRALGGRANITILDSVTQFKPGAQAGSASGVLTSDGSILLFRDGIGSGIEGQKSVFHELFHKGLRTLLAKQDYLSLMNNLYNSSPEVREQANVFMEASPEAVKGLPELEARALAVEEALATRAETLNTMNASALRKLGDWFATVAQRLGLPKLSNWLRTAGRKPLEAFIDEALRSAVSGATISADYTPAFRVPSSVEQVVGSMGPLSAPQKGALTNMLSAFNTTDDIDAVTKFRTQAVDAAAAVEKRLSERFNGAVRDALGNLNPMGLYRQAQDYAKMLLEFYQTGTLVKDVNTGLWRADSTQGIAPPTKVYDLINAWSQKNGYDFERGKQIVSRVLEGNRLHEMRESNKTQGTEFLLHLKDPEINTLKAAYDADPELQAISRTMDESRIGLVNHMESVGRLSPDQAKAWREVSGYVPFDRLDDFSERFAKVKKVSGKGLAQVGKLPELVGSINRPVGDVFENYLNTLGWMVGQVMKTDATVNTLRTLENMGKAQFLGNSTRFKSNTVGAYVDGELNYWELPSRYDVLAFKDLNPPKAGWLKALGTFSNLLRTTVTALPPFAIKQVTDDVQRAIMTSGVQNVGGLIYSTLTNFPKLALAELRGIQHPTVREFGALGLTGEYDFQQGKPAESLLKDLGLKKRGRFESLMHKLDGITRASDLAVRKAIYDHTLRETNDALLAQTRAREFINFRRRGANDFVGAMVSTIPFFNAYAQGMDVLYRAATGKDAGSSIDRAQALKMFWSRAAMLTAMATLYAMGKSDDDDYKEMDLRTRDNNWILPNGYKIPVPGEFAAIFKVIPERVVEYYRRQGTVEEQEAWEATRTALSYMAEQYVGRMTPIPQAAKPLLEAWTNFSFLTGRPLEGIYQKQMEPSRRRGADTSELAIAIANFSRDQIGVQVSPILVDNTLRGYLGSTAAMVTMVTDGMLNPDRVDRPLHKWALMSNYLYDPVGTRRVSEFYEAREKVAQVKSTLNELAKTDMKAAEAYADQYGDILSLDKTVNDTLHQLEQTRAYRKFLNSPDGAKEMSVEERTKELEEIRRYEVDLMGWVREAKTEINRAAGKMRI